MKCQHAQHGLLSTSGPRKLSAEVLAHLDGCTACKAWHVRLQEIDRAVPRLPVPDSSDAKAATIEEILQPITLPFEKPLWKRGKAWQRALVGIAASALLLVIGSRFFIGRTPNAVAAPAADPILAQLLNRNLSFAKATSTQAKVETLAALAQDLEDETRNLARVGSAEELETLADLYNDVVTKGLLAQAGDVPPDDCVKVLQPIADRLFQSSKNVAQLAQDVPPAAAPSLKKMAAIAENANQKLRKQTKDDKVTRDTPPTPPREGQS
jgi:hypothetical protein